jgi:hypothetical protein
MTGIRKGVSPSQGKYPSLLSAVGLGLLLLLAAKRSDTLAV